MATIPFDTLAAAQAAADKLREAIAAITAESGNRFDSRAAELRGLLVELESWIFRNCP